MVDGELVVHRLFKPQCFPRWRRSGRLVLDSPLEQLSAAAVRYRIAVGPQAGRKTMTLRSPGAMFGRHPEQTVHRPTRWVLHQCRRGLRSARTQQTRTRVPLCGSPAHRRAAPERRWRWVGGLRTQTRLLRWHHPRIATPGILPSALRASLRLFKIVPDDFVEPLEFMAHLPVRHPSGDLRLCKSAVLAICHRSSRRPGGAAPEQLVRLIHLVPLRGCESQRRGAVTVAPMAGQVATCADVWEFSRPTRPDDRRHYLEATVGG